MRAPLFRLLLVTLVTVVLSSLSPAPALADRESLWLKAGVRYRFNKSLRLDFDQHLRFATAPWEVDKVMPELAGNYDPAKWLRFSLGYRYIRNRNKFDRFVEWHRVYADVRVRTKVSKLRISNRLRYQEQRSSDFSAPYDRHWLRDELIFAYDTDRFWEPFVGAELFYAIGGEDGGGFQKYRLQGGVNFDLGDHQMGLEYRYQNKVLNDEAPSMHIVVLSYAFDI